MNCLLGITILAAVFVGACLWQLATTPQDKPKPTPEITDTERAEAGENAMWTEIGRVEVNDV